MSTRRRRRSGPILRRYTSLAFAIETLRHKRITLLHPRTWDDKDDAAVLDVFRREKGYATVLAACFTKASETYHHWKIFSGHAEGVCLQLDLDLFKRSASVDDRVVTGDVTYWSVQDMKGRDATLDDLPFSKRSAFKAEEEFRVVFGCHGDPVETYHVEIEPACVRRVILSPWLPDAIADSIKETLHGLPDFGELPVERSHLTNSKAWKRAVAKAVKLPSSTLITVP